jgi:Kef-type K+ transport system membrane component KefB/nucleotide-binding universal stress UspA family protein
VAPGITGWLFPHDDVQTAMLFTVGWIGVMLLLISTGYETDLTLLRRLGRAAGAVSAGSLLVPLSAGLGTGLAMPAAFRGETGDGVLFALFMGAALSISSLPVIGKILSEMGLMRRNFGQLTLAAGMANDIVGWILLGIVAGIATGGLDLWTVSVTVVGVASFFAVAFTVGQHLIDLGLRRARAGGPLAALSTTLIIALAAGSITQRLGVEAILGAFVVGILLRRSKSRDDETVHHLDALTTTWFAPVFFATAGLRVDLGLLADPTVAAWAVAVIAIASVSKYVGALAGARVAGLTGREGTALGVGLNARGALEIVIATVGLSLGVLNDESYAIIVVMAMATSMMAPPLLRATLRGWAGDPDELRRLEHEAELASNVVVRTRHVLLPTTGGLSSIMAAQIVDLAWPKETGITMLTAGGNGHGTRLDVLHDIFGDRKLDHVIAQRDTVEAILHEARLGAGAIVLGAVDSGGEGRLFTSTVDEVVARSTVPVVIVRRGRRLDTSLPWAYARALVGVAGTTSSRAAQEIAVNISASIGTELVLAHIVSQTAQPRDVSGSRRLLTGPVRAALADRVDPTGVGRQLVQEAIDHADRHGARSRAVLDRNSAPGRALVQLGATHHADLVVLGANRRNLPNRFFLGHTVEEVLSHCDATIVIVVLPTGTPPAQHQ